jgi:hypothetical protein
MHETGQRFLRPGKIQTISFSWGPQELNHMLLEKTVEIKKKCIYI